MSPFRSWLKPRSATLPVPRENVLVLGSGPGASLPYSFDQSWTLATVNASQVALPALCPDISFFGAAVLRNKPVNKEAKKQLEGRRTKSLVLIRGTQFPDRQRLRLLGLGYSYENVAFISKEYRAKCIQWASGIEGGIWPSNGIALGLICLHLGAKSITYTGFSLTQNGHSYNTNNRPRLHADADRRVLAGALEKGMPLFTNQKEFSEESGIPLVS